MATVACYVVLLLTSALTWRERDDARERYTWGRFHNEVAAEDVRARPWWQRDKLWAGVLVAATLAMCWYFA
jgi:hypothetical protein